MSDALALLSTAILASGYFCAKARKNNTMPTQSPSASSGIRNKTLDLAKSVSDHAARGNTRGWKASDLIWTEGAVAKACWRSKDVVRVK